MTGYAWNLQLWNLAAESVEYSKSSPTGRNFLDVTASVPQWPALDSGYEDEFGPIDLEVYQAAGEIWPNAAVFGEFALQDRDEAFSLMLKAVASVSSMIASGTHIEHLKRYLNTTYKNLVA